MSLGFFRFKLWSVWWVDLGGKPDLHPPPHTHSTVLLPSLLNRIDRENKMKKKLMNKDRACVVQENGE